MAVFCVQLLTVAWTGYGETTYLPILHGLSYLPSLWQFALQICRHPHCGRIRPDLKHGFFNLPPLSVFRDIFLRHVDCHRAVRHGGDHLTEGLRPHVAHGVNAGNTEMTVLCPWDIKQMSKTIICTRIAAIAAVCCSLFRAELRHQSVHLRFAGLVQCAAQRYLRFTQSEFLHLFQLGAHQPRGGRGP